MCTSSAELCLGKPQSPRKPSSLHRKMPGVAEQSICQLPRPYFSPLTWMICLTVLERTRKGLNFVINSVLCGQKQVCMPGSGYQT